MAAAELNEEIARLVEAVESMSGDERETAATAAALAGVAVLEEIRDAVQQIAANAASGTKSAKEAAAETEPGYGWGDAFKPLTDPLRNSKLGRIGGRFKSRFGPAWKAFGKTKAGKGLISRASGLFGAARGAGAGAGAAGGGAAGGAAGGVARGAAAGPWGAVAGAAIGLLMSSAAEKGKEGGEGEGEKGGEESGTPDTTKMLGPAGSAVGMVVSVTLAMKELGDQVVDFAYEMETANRRLSEFSAGQSLAWSELDANRIQRSMLTGDNTAGSARDLATAIDRFENATRPFDELSTNLQNIVGGKLMGMVASIVEMISPVADAANRWLGTSDSDVGEGQGADWMRLMAQDEERKRQATASRMDAVRSHHNRK